MRTWRLCTPLWLLVLFDDNTIEEQQILHALPQRLQLLLAALSALLVAARLLLRVGQFFGALVLQRRENCVHARA